MTLGAAMAAVRGERKGREEDLFHGQKGNRKPCRLAKRAFPACRFWRAANKTCNELFYLCLFFEKGKKILRRRKRRERAGGSSPANPDATHAVGHRARLPLSRRLLISFDCATPAMRRIPATPLLVNVRSPVVAVRLLFGTPCYRGCSPLSEILRQMPVVL